MSKPKLQYEYTGNYNTKWYSLKEDLIYENIKVPKNIFFTDLASVPIGLRWIYKPIGKYTRAAIFHDWLCSIRAYSKVKAHWKFLKIMKEDKVNFLTRWIFFLTVFIFYYPKEFVNRYF